MFFNILFAMLLNPIRSVEGTPTYQEEYRAASYVPQYYNSWRGLQVIAPNTAYVAAAGPDSLYFIDTRYDNETAAHIKEQIEWAMLPNKDEHFFIDEIAATASVRKSGTNETVFEFDPPFARVFFARFMNKQNPSLQLPEHEDGGDWVVNYNIGNLFKERDIQACSDHGCNSASDCKPHNCDSCHIARVDNECEHPTVNAVGACKKKKNKKCPKKDFSDLARTSGETDAAYYARLDAHHWGEEEE